MWRSPGGGGILGEGREELGRVESEALRGMWGGREWGGVLDGRSIRGGRDGED